MKQYSEYKDSGVKWIGDIPSHWEVRKLKTLLLKPLQYGANSSGIPFNENLPRYIRITDITLEGKLKDSDKLSLSEEDAKPYILNNNDVLFARSGATVGKTFIYKSEYGKSAFAGYLIKASLNAEIKPDLLYLFTQSNIYDLWKNSIFIQSTIQNIGADKYSQLIIPISPLPEQQAIVSYLDAKVAKIDSYIATATKKIAALDELKQETIANAVTKGINPDAQMKDSGIPWIGMVPENWEVIKLKFLFNEITEKGHPEEPCLCSTQKYGVIPQSMYENRVVVVNKGLENLKFVRKGNFVISLRSFQGGIEIAHYQGIISAAYTILSLRNNKVASDYIKNLFKSSSFIQLLQTCVTGIREGQNINYELLRKQFLPVPPLSEQTEIVAYIDRKVAQIDQMKAAERSQIEKLKEYKQRLISDVVTGKIKVTND